MRGNYATSVQCIISLMSSIFNRLLSNRPNPRNRRHHDDRDDAEELNGVDRHRQSQPSSRNHATSSRQLVSGSSDRQPDRRHFSETDDDSSAPPRVSRHNKPQWQPPAQRQSAASPQRPPKLPQKKRQQAEVRFLEYSDISDAIWSAGGHRHSLLIFLFFMH